jgi:hypothetical protein
VEEGGGKGWDSVRGVMKPEQDCLHCCTPQCHSEVGSQVVMCDLIVLQRGGGGCNGHAVVCDMAVLQRGALCR